MKWPPLEPFGVARSADLPSRTLLALACCQLLLALHADQALRLLQLIRTNSKHNLLGAFMPPTMEAVLTPDATRAAAAQDRVVGDGEHIGKLTDIPATARCT